MVAFHTEYVMIKLRKRLRKATQNSEVQKMVSLKDIAKECGVSTATVSKALNGQHDIGEETKARVRETAERMGYFPNAAARALKTNRSYNVGVLFQEEAGSGLTHEYFSGVLNGIKVQVEKMGYDVTFINNSYGVKKTSFFEHCRYRNFEGIVIVCADFASQGVLELMNSAFPVVTIDQKVTFDTTQGNRGIQAVNVYAA